MADKKQPAKQPSAPIPASPSSVKTTAIPTKITRGSETRTPILEQAKPDFKKPK